MPVIRKIRYFSKQGGTYCFEFTCAERQVIDHRIAEPKPEFASSKDIAKIFGKPFSV